MTDPFLVPVLVNPKEHQADQLLQEVAAENGDRLLTKVRLADVIDTSGWKQSRSDAHGFSLRSHLDFVMVNAETSAPIFAVELDGAAHRRDPVQRRRDTLKDELCHTAGLPLLRVGSDFARREGKQIVLKYLCDAYYLSVAFEAAQEAGSIPWDEPFDHAMFIQRDEQTGGLLFGSLDARARADLARLNDSGKIPHYVPDSWVGDADEWGDVRADVYLGVGAERTIIGSATVRHFDWFGLAASEFAEELAVLELRRNVDHYLAGEPVAWGKPQFQQRFREFISSTKPMSRFSSTTSNPDQRIPYPAFRGDGLTVEFVDEAA